MTGVRHGHTATGVGMKTLEELQAENTTLTNKITELETQLQNADPEGEKTRSTALVQQVADLTERNNALKGNNDKLKSEKDAAEVTSATRLTRIESLEQQLNDAADGVDVEKIRQDAAEAASIATSERKDAEYKSVVDERDALLAENSNFKTRDKRRDFHNFLRSGLRAIKADPDFDQVWIDRATAANAFEPDGDGGYVAKDSKGAILTGRTGLLSAEEYFDGIVDKKFRNQPTGSGAGGGSRVPPGNGNKSKLEPGSPSHKAHMRMNATPAEFQKLYGPGGQYHN